MLFRWIPEIPGPNPLVFVRHLDARAVSKELVFLVHGLLCDWRHSGRHQMGEPDGGSAKRD